MIEGFNLSPVQRDLWLHINQDTAPWFAAGVVIFIDGPLDPDHLKQTFNNLIAHHDILNMGFHTNPSMKYPLQSPESQQIVWVDLPEQLESTEAIALLDQLGSDIAKESSQDAVVHAALVPMLKNRTALVLRFSALIADSPTLDLVAYDLAQTFQAMVQAEEPTFDPPHYLAVAEWLDEIRESDDAREGVAFWRIRNQDTNPGFPWEKPTDSASWFYPKTVSAEPLKLEASSLQAIAQRLQTSPETICLAAWFLLLFKHLDDDELVIGCMTDGRSSEDMVDILGPLTRCLPLSMDRDLQQTFEQWVAQLSDLCEENLAWQDCFERQNSGYTRFAFSSCSFPEPIATLAHTVTVACKRVHNARFNLKLEIQFQGNKWQPFLHFDQHRFHEQDVQVLLERYVIALERLCANPQQHLGGFDLPLLPQDRHTLAKLENPRTYPSHAFYHDAFEYQARSTPQAIALECDSQKLSYADLNARANQLARELRTQGAGPEQVVGLFAERSIDFMVAMLAIFKSGAVYLPLDPNYPGEMLKQLVTEADAKILLTTSHLRAQAPLQDSPVILLDGNPAWRTRQAETNLVPLHHPEQSAYMIFTSGSTGKPKGVLIPHKHLLHQALTIRDQHDLSAKDRFLQFSSFNFDASLEQVLPPFLCGATVVLRGKESWSTHDFDQKVRELDLTIVNVPTAYWHVLTNQWAQFKNLDSMGSLRLVIAGGELMMSDHLQQWQHSVGRHIALVNAYGPTETTITATMYQVPQTYSQERPYHRIPIGTPLFNRTCYVLDSHMQPSPTGLTGMLYLGGAGIARGYHRRPGLTASVFLPDPFATKPGSRMYCTGDQARILPDGQLQFLGRNDTQVKIRGYRIELGHIEQVLSTFPGIDQVVVQPQSHENSGDTRLLAYFVNGQANPIATLELREYLKERLPDYMIPSVYLKLEQIPLKPNGKIDRQALPLPDELHAQMETGQQTKPRTQEEEVLVGIWTELLNLSQFGIHDSFFDLGGHSLLATRLVFKVRTLFGVNLSLKAIFNNPTIAALAKQISDLTLTSRYENLPALTPAPAAEFYPLSFSQRRVWFVYSAENNSAYHVPLPIRIFGKLNPAALEKVLANTIERHQVFRTVYSTHQGHPIQRVLPFEGWTLDHVHLEEFPEADQKSRLALLLQQNYHEPFDLEQGPIIRAKLVHLSDREFMLLICIHHIASDGWSLGILVREITNSYEALIQETPQTQPPPPLQFIDYAVWQRQWLAGDTLQKEIAFWADRLKGAPASQALPYDDMPHEGLDHSGSLERFRLPIERQEELLLYCRQKGITLFMLLVAGFKLVLHHMTDSTDVVIGTDVANRNHEETESMVGFFINQLVLRTSLHPDLSLKDLLEKILADTLESYSHQDLPFDKLVEALNPARGPHQTPFFNTKLVLQNLPQEPLQVQSLVLVPEPSPSNETKLNLQFNLQETEEGLIGELHYKTQLFKPKTVKRILRYFDETLTQLLANPQQSIAELRGHLTQFEEQYRQKLKQEQQQSARSMFAKLTT